MIDHRPIAFTKLRGLRGIPDALIEAHLALYEGYVKNLNRIRDHLARYSPDTPEGSELKRRVGFEMNGMRLHELYFKNLSPGGTGRSPLAPGLIEEFTAMGQMRGIGWVILYRDPETRELANYWISLHEEGHPAGFTPILVMDVWEHAYTGLDRPRYVESFLANVNWNEVEARLR